MAARPHRFPLQARVRRAVESLVGAFGRVVADPDEAYRGAVRVMMRIVFLAFASQRGLLPGFGLPPDWRHFPDVLPWLPLDVDDRIVRHVLDADFDGLEVEQIGYLYEDLLSFQAFRASEVTLGRSDGSAVTLTALEARGSVPKRIVPGARDKLLAVTGGDVSLSERLLPWYGLIRTDLHGMPVVVRPGELFVAESALRRKTGAHYTPPSLAKEVVEGALEPLVYRPGPLQTADRREWELRSSEEILDLKVADIAMGSGAFLVAAARYLGRRLVETSPEWALLDAQRKVVERCLYGVDIDPTAVEMAKLSLWLVAMDPARPFDFLDDCLRAGDSLLGLAPASKAPINQAFRRLPLDWPLAFPQVFQKGGFDAVIGNPPFLGGARIGAALGSDYRDHLVRTVAGGTKGAADLVAYFVLRAHSLLNSGGQTGLIATNTLAQGDTREVGLDRLVADGITIRRAIKSAPWPSRSAALQYCAIWTSAAPLGSSAARVLGGAVVAGITSSLEPQSRVTGNPLPLVGNLGIAFEGSKITGSGFVLTPDEAASLLLDPRNSSVVLPYLNGQDLNSSPSLSPTRWVINFHDWDLDRAQTYPDCYRRIEALVRPVRERLTYSRRAARIWWQFEARRAGMLQAIGGRDHVIAIAKVSKTAIPVRVPASQVFDQKVVVFASDAFEMLALLDSSLHYAWAASRSATMKADLSYSISDVFETFPLPVLTAALRSLGARLDAERRAVMLSRNIGLTATYNLVFDPRCRDAEIALLRELHKEIDEAACVAYGWGDLVSRGLGHGFHPAGAYTRYTVGLSVHREILDRLLELNHARH